MKFDMNFALQTILIALRGLPITLEIVFIVFALSFILGFLVAVGRENKSSLKAKLTRAASVGSPVASDSFGLISASEQSAIAFARSHPDVLEDFLRTKRVPLGKLAKGAGVERKSLERHRRYLVAVLLICTNGYEILRGHIMQVLRGGRNP